MKTPSASAPLTLERLQEVLHYDPDTGLHTWLVQLSSRGKAGDVAGCQRREGYVYIGIDGMQHAAHRLAWLVMTGAWPVDEIDHRDTDRANNRFKNLRPADSLLNQQNRRRACIDNKSGFLGVSKNDGSFQAQIRVQGKAKYLGRFATPEAAHEAYLAAKRIHHPGNTL